MSSSTLEDLQPTSPTLSLCAHSNRLSSRTVSDLSFLHRLSDRRRHVLQKERGLQLRRFVPHPKGDVERRRGPARLGDERRVSAQDSRRAAPSRYQWVYRRAVVQVADKDQYPPRAIAWTRPVAGVLVLCLLLTFTMDTDGTFFACPDLYFNSQIGKHNAKFSTGFSIQDMPVSSALLFPAAESVQVHDGSIHCSGWAYSGGGRWIERVEVSPDGGFTWCAFFVPSFLLHFCR